MRVVLTLAITLIGLASAAFAQGPSLVASLDRQSIRSNESFTYTLRAEGQVSGRPDFSVLQRDFDQVQSRSARNIQIVNGRTTEIAEWQVELMPRGPGEFELPAVQLGNLASNAIRVQILPPAEPVDAEADVFLEVELDRNEAYVQAQVIFTLRLYVGIRTDREGLSVLPIDGGDAIVERLGSDRDYQTVRGERVYRVLERKFAIFPQTAGVMSIGPIDYEATIRQGLGGFARRQSLRSDVLELTVLPAVAPPPSHPNAVWLPAHDLRIEESWVDGVDFEQGVPRTRELAVIATGVLDTQLPELELTTATGLRQYADQPELRREVTSDGIEARHTERFAVIAQQSGTLEFPAVEMPWWDVDQRRWQVARIEPRTIEVAPSAGGGDPATEPLAPAASDSVVERDTGVWPWITGGLGVGWLATLFAWVWSRRSRLPVRSKRSKTSTTSGRALVKQLSAACRVDDAKRARDLLLEWGGRQFSDDPPTSLGELAGRLAGPLADEIESLEMALYGRGEQAWRGERLAELLKSTQSVALGATNKGQDPLVPLYR